MFTQKQMLAGLLLLAGATALMARNSLSDPPARRRPAAAPPSMIPRNTIPAPPIRGSSHLQPGALTNSTENINPNLFGKPTPTPEAKPKQRRKPRVSSPLPLQDPLTDYTFTGVVTVEGRAMALIENRQTGEGIYVAVGDRFLNGTVAEIGEGAVSLIEKDRRRFLLRNEQYGFTPLNANAPYLNAAPKPNTGNAAPFTPTSQDMVPPSGTPAGMNSSTVITTTGELQVEN